MKQQKDGSKKGFNKAMIGRVILYCSIILITWEALFVYFNYTKDVNTKVCFKSFGVIFGCVPNVMQKGIYYEANTPIKLSDEFCLDNDDKADFYVKENGEYKETTSFNEEGNIRFDLYVKYKNKITKMEKYINIGDSKPPEIIQNEIPKVKVGEVISVSDYITLTDNKDPNPYLAEDSIVAMEIGEFTKKIYAYDNHNNNALLLFKYEVIA